MKKLVYSILVIALMSFSSVGFGAATDNHVLTVTLSEVMTLALGGAAPTITIAAMDDVYVTDATPPTLGVEHNRVAAQKITLAVSALGGTWTKMDAKVSAPLVSFTSGVGVADIMLVTDGTALATTPDIVTGIPAGNYLASPINLTYAARARAGAIVGADKVITITYTLTAP